MANNIKHLINEKKTNIDVTKFNFGIILEIRDGCAIIRGLDKAFVGEKLILAKTGGIASVLSIMSNGDIYALIFTEIHDVAQDEIVFKTEKLLSIDISKNILGKFLKPL